MNTSTILGPVGSTWDSLRSMVKNERRHIGDAALALLFVREGTSGLLTGVQAGADAGEGVVDPAAQEGEDQDDYDSDKYENECILYQALALLLQLLDLVAHLVRLLFGM